MQSIILNLNIDKSFPDYSKHISMEITIELLNNIYVIIFDKSQTNIPKQPSIAHFHSRMASSKRHGQI